MAVICLQVLAVACFAGLDISPERVNKCGSKMDNKTSITKQPSHTELAPNRRLAALHRAVPGTSAKATHQSGRRAPDNVRHGKVRGSCNSQRGVSRTGTEG